MLKKFFFLIIIIIVSQSFLVYSSDVDVISEVYTDKTLFTYKFIFNENESYKSFSIEKPRESTINYILDSDSLTYSIAGDFFIFKPKDSDIKEYEVSFISTSTSQKIKESGSYLTYLNFNFDVDLLTYTLIIKDNFSQVKEVSPRDYEITETGNYYWEIENPQKDLLFLLNFENPNSTDFTSNDLNKLFLLLIIPIILFIILIFVIKKYNLKEENNKNSKVQEKPKTKAKPKKKQAVKTSKTKNIKKIEENKKFEEIKEKYLTENEKEIFETVRKNEGILQNDILNHVPNITKSNLSKIISKLHSRKILSRIRVGKVNKIYLGEKLKDTSESQEENSENKI